MSKRKMRGVRVILAATSICLSGLMAHAEIILDCSVYAYKLEKSFLGLNKRVSTKLQGFDPNWKKFCNGGHMSFEGSTIVCTETFKSYLRVNPEQIVAKVKRFECPEGAKYPNTPMFSEQPEYSDDGIKIIRIYKDHFKRKDPNKHFREQNCRYIGPVIAVPAIQTKFNQEIWTTAEFPKSYPFIFFVHPDDYEKVRYISDTDYLYERLVFGDIDETYKEKSGRIDTTYIDFGLGEYNTAGWIIDPDTEEKKSKQPARIHQCEKIEN